MKDTKTKIGKDVIESLTMGMYEDARFIYREYVQNSADQIDAAVEVGILDNRDKGYIDITIDKESRTISIKDNATGIRSDNAVSFLKNIARSSKDRTKNKGFRGIGRLGGLGYCEELIFETSFKGESIKTVLRWDSKKLKDIINDRSKQEDAVEVVEAVTEYISEECEQDVHYFKVFLKGVTNDTLLDKNGIIQYLSMVAPVPFEKGFVYSSKIIREANEKGHEIPVYKVFVNSDPVCKLYTSTIYTGEGHKRQRVSQIIDIQTFDLGGKIWGWYSISGNLTKQIPGKANPARGMRLRKGNIQVGSDAALAGFFTEDRFNYYFFGEVYAFDKNLIPNARRDYFIENQELSEFETNIKEYFSEELSKLVRFASSVKSHCKPIQDLETLNNSYQEKLKEGFSSKQERKDYEDKLEEIKDKAAKAEEYIENLKNTSNNGSPKDKVVDHLTSDLRPNTKEVVSENPKKTVFVTDSLSKLDRKERKLIGKVFGIIDQVLPKELASNLKEKIKEEFQ